MDKPSENHCSLKRKLGESSQRKLQGQIYWNHFIPLQSVWKTLSVAFRGVSWTPGHEQQNCRVKCEGHPPTGKSMLSGPGHHRFATLLPVQDLDFVCTLKVCSSLKALAMLLDHSMISLLKTGIKYCILNEVITQATPTPLGKPSILGIYKGLVASFQHGWQEVPLACDHMKSLYQPSFFSLPGNP